MKRILLLLIAVLMNLYLFAQTGNAVFDDSKLHEIRIDFEMDAWFDSLTVDYKYNLRDQADTIPDRYFECAMTFDGIALESVGLRQKGNSSYQLQSPVGIVDIEACIAGSRRRYTLLPEHTVHNRFFDIGRVAGKIIEV